MKLKELAAEYRSGGMTKQDYIEKMHEIHRVLFEYAEHIRDTDMQSIEIRDGAVIMTTCERGIKLTNVYPQIAFGRPITEMEPIAEPASME